LKNVLLDFSETLVQEDAKNAETSVRNALTMKIAKNVLKEPIFMELIAPANALRELLQLTEFVLTASITAKSATLSTPQNVSPAIKLLSTNTESADLIVETNTSQTKTESATTVSQTVTYALTVNPAINALTDSSTSMVKVVSNHALTDMLLKTENARNVPKNLTVNLALLTTTINVLIASKKDSYITTFVLKSAHQILSQAIKIVSIATHLAKLALMTKLATLAKKENI